MIFEGGCYCGRVRYKAEGEPRLRAQCHCRPCQYFSGRGAQPVHADGAERVKPSSLFRRFWQYISVYL